MQRIKDTLAFLRLHPVLAAAIVASIVTSFIVPPDEGWISYFDLKTLSCLFGILAIVEALRNLGAFEAVARRFVARFTSGQATALALIGCTAIVSMFATNDMALVMMLPLSAATLLAAGWGRMLPFVFVMQNLAANLGGMIMPFGNPQNLYLFEHFQIPLTGFLATMAFPFALSMALIFAISFVKTKGMPKSAPQIHRVKRKKKPKTVAVDAAVTDAASANAAASTSASTAAANAAAAEATRISKRAALAEEEAKKSRARLKGMLPSRHESGLTKRQACAIYAVLLLLVISSVFRLVPWWMVTLIIIGALAILDMKALKATDFGLLLTFICFFIFSGNMARIPAVQEPLSWLMAQEALLTSAGFSQVISNVPAAVLLAQFTTDYAPILIGVNIGGAGTIVASLASLITLAQYRHALNGHPDNPTLEGQTVGTFFREFAIWNSIFLVVLVAVCFILI